MRNNTVALKSSMATTSSPFSRKLEILYYTPYFRETLKEAIGFTPALAEDLCTVSTDHNRISSADALVFHLPNMKEPPRIPKKPGQPWVAMSMESDANYPHQTDPDFMRHFDLRMNFRRDSDVPLLYLEPSHLPLFNKPPKWKFRRAPAVYFASNNFALNNRHELVQELMKHLKVDSYGKSLQNRYPVKDKGRMTKLDTISRYLFYFAFENSNSTDYVSEKVFDGLIAGTVPVYLGAPNIDDYLPGNKCIIKVSDFSDPLDLARYLISLSKNQKEYRSYLAWKREPLRQSFLDLIQPMHTPPLRRLCHKLADVLNGPCAMI